MMFTQSSWFATLFLSFFLVSTTQASESDPICHEFTPALTQAECESAGAFDGVTLDLSKYSGIPEGMADVFYNQEIKTSTGECYGASLCSCLTSANVFYAGSNPTGVLSCAEIVGKTFTMCTHTGSTSQACSASRRTRSRRQLLKDDSSSSFLLEKGSADYHRYADLCGSFEYDVFLFVDDHFYAVAHPKEEAASVGCPAVVTHATFQHGSEHYKKEIMAWKTKEEADSVFPEDQSLFIGTFKVSDVVRAHEGVDPVPKAYDVLTNNCADFILSLASSLNVKIDAKITTYVTRRLVAEAGKSVADKIRKSANFFNLFPSRNLRTTSDYAAAEDEQVIKAAVAMRAAGLDQ
jgi:hypothetical protein